MNYLFLFALSLNALVLPAQKVIHYAVPARGLIQLSSQTSIPRIEAGYTLWLPEAEEPKGLVVFTHARRDTANRDSLINYALSKHLAVLYATTGNRVEFFFDTDKLLEIEGYIHSVLRDHGIPQENLLFCGMSLEGTRALKLAIFGQTSLSKHRLKPKAIAICDAPLDMVRFHREMVKARDLGFNEIAAKEGAWVSAYLESRLGGSPQENMAAYVQYSPYCYQAGGGVHLDALRDISIRAYTEPDVLWWMETRRKDYYGMNAIDLAGLINELNIKGNAQAELILTEDKGFRPDGARHPHSWSIVNEKDLIHWFLDVISN